MDHAIVSEDEYGGGGQEWNWEGSKKHGCCSQRMMAACVQFVNRERTISRTVTRPGNFQRISLKEAWNCLAPCGSKDFKSMKINS